MKALILSFFVTLAVCAVPLVAQTNSEATKVDQETSVLNNQKGGGEEATTAVVRKVTRISNTVERGQEVKLDAKGGAVVPNASKGIRIHSRPTKQLSKDRESPVSRVSRPRAKEPKNSHEERKEQ